MSMRESLLLLWEGGITGGDVIGSWEAAGMLTCERPLHYRDFINFMLMLQKSAGFSKTH